MSYEMKKALTHYQCRPLVEENLSLKKRIAELEELVDMVAESESADKSLIPAFYHSFLHKAKQLRNQTRGNQ